MIIISLSWLYISTDKQFSSNKFWYFMLKWIVFVWCDHLNLLAYYLIICLLFDCLLTGVRLVSTRRPITPRDPRRQLYGKVTLADRPPSAFRYRAIKFNLKMMHTNAMNKKNKSHHQTHFMAVDCCSDQIGITLQQSITIGTNIR